MIETVIVSAVTLFLGLGAGLITRKKSSHPGLEILPAVRASGGHDWHIQGTETINGYKHKVLLCSHCGREKKEQL